MDEEINKEPAETGKRKKMSLAAFQITCLVVLLSVDSTAARMKNILRYFVVILRLKV